MCQIIVLEDETACMAVFRASLVRGGYKPLIANTCFEVQRHLAGNAVRALVVDLFLCTQWCHGTDIALRAQKTHQDLRFLFVSGTAFGDWSHTDRQNVDKLGRLSWALLQKPFAPAMLLAHLAALLNRPPLQFGPRPGCPHNSGCALLNPHRTGSPVLL